MPAPEDPQTSFTLSLPQSLRDAAQTRATVEERSLACVIRRALAAFLAVEAEEEASDSRTPELPGI